MLGGWIGRDEKRPEQKRGSVTIQLRRERSEEPTRRVQQGIELSNNSAENASSVRDLGGALYGIAPSFSSLTAVGLGALGLCPSGAPALLAILGARCPCISIVKAVGCALLPAALGLDSGQGQLSGAEGASRMPGCPMAHVAHPACMCYLAALSTWFGRVLGLTESM